MASLPSDTPVPTTARVALPDPGARPDATTASVDLSGPPSMDMPLPTITAEVPLLGPEDDEPPTLEHAVSPAGAPREVLPPVPRPTVAAPRKATVRRAVAPERPAVLDSLDLREEEPASGWVTTVATAAGAVAIGCVAALGALWWLTA